ncbi:hypothetical protein E2C01_050237 [Portunus trituberculatus]|uniref:Uncharacterized protein n=1 Tax=Portunus trituberculatus TaxID=210409 RepID=A0A5B7GID1_PORTR|nr:hypothetical protein [Portunus trituberculatus]
MVSEGREKPKNIEISKDGDLGERTERQNVLHFSKPNDGKLRRFKSVGMRPSEVVDDLARHRKQDPSTSTAPVVAVEAQSSME